MFPVNRKVYPHLYEYNLLKSQGKELNSQMYARKYEGNLVLETKKIYLVRHDREKNLGTNKEIHKII